MRQRFHFYKSNSGAVARSRLKLLLVADKTCLSPGFLELIRDDMVHVLSRYMEIEPGQVDIRLTRVETAGTREILPALSASIPIRQISDKGI